jgi:DNA-binding MarR family transcriptional regulator
VQVTHSTPDEVASAVLDTVPQAMRAIRRLMRSGRATGLSVPQFRILLFARRSPGSNLSAAADHLGISLPAASQLVDRLVRAGMLDRSIRPHERRHVELRVTDIGNVALAECDALAREWLKGRFETLNGERRDAIVEALAEVRLLLADDTAGNGTGPDGSA